MSTPPSPTFADHIQVLESPPRHQNFATEPSSPPTRVGETPTEIDALRNQMNLLEIRVDQSLKNGFNHMELSFDVFQHAFNNNSAKVEKSQESLEATNRKIWVDLVTNTTTLKRMQVDHSKFEKRVDARFDSINSQFEGINPKFEDINPKFEGIDARLENMEKRIDARFEGINTKFEGINEKFARIENMEKRINTRFEGSDARFSRIETNIENLDNKFEGYFTRLFAMIEQSSFT